MPTTDEMKIDGKKEKSSKDLEFFMYQYKTRSCTVVSGAGHNRLVYITR